MTEPESNAKVVQLNKERFNKMSVDWDTDPERAKVSLQVSEAIQQVFDTECQSLKEQNEKLKIMDFGTGTGTLSLSLYKNYMDKVDFIDAVDVTEGMLQVLEKKRDNMGISADKIRTNAMDILNINENTASHVYQNKGQYDLIVCSMTLHHVYSLHGILKVLYDCLREGGFFIFTDIDKDDPNAEHFHPHHMHHGEVPHSGGFRESDLKQWLGDIGFHHSTFHRIVKIQKPGSHGKHSEFQLLTTCTQK